MISHKHKCIFIHIPKTAGMSIEKAFATSLGLDFYKSQCPPLGLSFNVNREIGPLSLAHLPAKDYVPLSYLSEELFKNYFKFSFVRNPYDRMVSIYKYFGYHRILSFEGFLKYRLPKMWKERYDFLMPQVNYIYDEDGKLLVDFVGRFENLKEDFEEMRKNIDTPVNDLFHINKPPQKHNWYSRWNRRYIFKELKQRPYLIKHIYLFSPSDKKYYEYYTEETKKIVEGYYLQDIERFNYDFR